MFENRWLGGIFRLNRREVYEEWGKLRNYAYIHSRNVITGFVVDSYFGGRGGTCEHVNELPGFTNMRNCFTTSATVLLPGMDSAPKDLLIQTYYRACFARISKRISPPLRY